MAPRLIIILISSGSKKAEPRYTCLCDAKASHSQRMWAEVFSSAPHFYTVEYLTALLGEDVFSEYYVQSEVQ
jgi:hypothetical protein